MSTYFHDVNGKASTLRRSQRVCLSVDVQIRLERAAAKAPPELTKTLIVNAHGALLLLRGPVATGDLLFMKNMKTGEEVACRVVDVNTGNAGPPEVGVEFVKPSPKFWHIAFPPSDWSARGPESKTHGPQAVAALAKVPKP